MGELGTEELQRTMREAGAAMRAEPVPDVSRAVRARLERPAPASAGQHTKRWRGALAATLAGVALALVPGVRGAVADLIDALPGITLRTDRGGELRTPPTSEPGATLGSPLGLVGETDLATARAQVSFEVPLPTALGEPDAVYVRADVVTMLWRASSELPALPGTNIGLILDVVDGSNGPVFEKLLLGVEVEWFEIDGASAAWVGTPHPLVIVNPEGIPDRELQRTSARTLLLSGATTIRVESMLTRDQAVALAQSLR
jgi:hypothetical protein